MARFLQLAAYPSTKDKGDTLKSFTRSSSLITFAIASLLGTSVQAASLGADFTGGSIFSNGIYNNIGWSFTVNSSVTVNGLGLFDEGAPGLTNRHTVGLWDSSNTLLASTTIFNGSTAVSSASSLGRWLFEEIAALTLTPGTYAVGAFYGDSDADLVIGSATGLTTDKSISFLASLASDASSFARPGAYGLVQPGIFGPNLRLTDSQVPEPGTLAMLGLGLAGIALSRRRKS